MSLESGQRDALTQNAKRGGKATKKGYSWYSRMNTTKKAILWLIALLAILGIALGVGLGVGLHRGTNDEERD